MARLHLLGTGAALSGPDRTTTMLAFESDGSVVLVDCGGDAIQRALAAGLDLDAIELLILTHEHPDHVSGFPLLVEKLWLARRRRPLPIRGPESALGAARRAFGAFDTSGWKGLPELEWEAVPAREDAEVWTSERWRITGSPGAHGVPSVAIRVEDRGGGGVAAYSSDTARTDSVTRLAAGVDLLVHEATGDFKGHTSLQDAAHVARHAGAGTLVVVHLPPEIPQDDLREARASFPALHVGEDGGVHDF